MVVKNKFDIQVVLDWTNYIFLLNVFLGIMFKLYIGKYVNLITGMLKNLVKM